MSISVKIEKKFSKLGEDLIKKATSKFYIDAAAALPPLIVQTILKGFSPIEGEGRFPKYSPSYIDQIEGKVKFIRVGGKVIPIYPGKNDVVFKKGKSVGAHTAINYFNGVAIQGKSVKAHTVLRKVQSFGKGLGNGKLKSPVNLKVTGGMLDSIRAIPSEKYLTIKFDSPIAKYHNNLSNGKMFRPMLPYGGKDFSSLIMKKLKALLKEAFNN